MEKTGRKQGLIFILLRYALSCIAGLLVWVDAWWLLFIAAVSGGLVLPAQAAEQSAASAIQQMTQADAFSADQVPPLCGYLWVADDGAVPESSLSGAALADAQNYLRTGANRNGRYHCMAHLSAGTIVLQYRFRTEYAEPSLRFLPSIEGLGLIVLLTGAAVVLGLITVVFARWLKRALTPLTDAANQLCAGDLERPLPKTPVKEFSQALGAMESLQVSLRDSLSRQWDMEHSRVLQMDALAHDLRTPLTVIDGNAQLLQETTLSTDQTESVEAILTASSRATEYVASLRAMAKVAAQPESTPQGSCVMGAFLEKLRTDAQAVCEVHAQHLAWQQESAAAARSLSLNEQELHRAVMNLVQNAVEASASAGGGSIAVSCAVADGLLAFVVTDSGAGFSQKALRHGCDPLFTEHAARTAGSHTGFGLSFAADFARHHGGKVKLENPQGGHGRVTLTVALPTL